MKLRALRYFDKGQNKYRYKIQEWHSHEELVTRREEVPFLWFFKRRKIVSQEYKEIPAFSGWRLHLNFFFDEQGFYFDTEEEAKNFIDGCFYEPEEVYQKSAKEQR